MKGDVSKILLASQTGDSTNEAEIRRNSKLAVWLKACHEDTYKRPDDPNYAAVSLVQYFSESTTKSKIAHNNISAEARDSPPRVRPVR